MKEMESWPRLAGQVSGEDKLFPGSDYAASVACKAKLVSNACRYSHFETVHEHLKRRGIKVARGIAGLRRTRTACS